MGGGTSTQEVDIFIVRRGGFSMFSPLDLPQGRPGGHFSCISLNMPPSPATSDILLSRFSSSFNKVQ